MDERAYWLWFALVFGQDSPRLWKLSKDHDTAEQFYEAVKADRITDMNSRERARAAEFDIRDAAIMLDECLSDGINVFCYESEGYPSGLKNTADPPAVIFVIGSLDFLENNMKVAVAGTRSPSDYSRRITSVLTEKLCRRGCVITSGMAMGLDSIACDAAIKCSSKVLGVGGLAIDYYLEDELAAAIVDHGGAVISETCLAMEMPQVRFTKRNRIISGICDALIMIEASSKSRGLDLCDHFIYDGKLLFAVPPHDIMDARYSGQSWLLRRGCRPIFSEQDVMFALAHLGVDKIRYDDTGAKYTTVDDYSFFADESPDAGTNDESRKADAPADESVSEDDADKPSVDLSELDGADREICEILLEGPQLADAVAARLEIDISEILSAVTMLEIKGYVRSLPGNRIGLV